MTRGEIHQTHEVKAYFATRRASLTLLDVFSVHEYAWLNEKHMDAWPKECPYDEPETVAAWPSMRSLARYDGRQHRPTGMHLIAFSDKYVTIGLERP